MTVDQFDTLWLTVVVFGYVIVAAIGYNNGVSLGAKS